MKFTGIDIDEREEYSNGKWKKHFKGKITFEGEKGDEIRLALNDEDSKAFIRLALPLFERVLNEKFEGIREELNNE